MFTHLKNLKEDGYPPGPLRHHRDVHSRDGERAGWRSGLWRASVRSHHIQVYLLRKNAGDNPQRAPQTIQPVENSYGILLQVSRLNPEREGRN